MKNIFFLLIFVLLAFNCSDELRLDPISQISSSSFWKTEDDAKAGLFSMYVDLRNEAENRDLIYLGEARSDAFEASFSTGPNQYWDNILSPNNPGPDWRGLFRVIHDANLVLQYVPNISFESEKDKNDVLAQAYSMRAYVYYILVRTWGEVPVVTTPTEGDFDHKPRESKEKVFELIKADINNALQIFPDKEFPNGRNVWSHPATNVLKADVLLWTGKMLGGGESDFQNALNALNDISTGNLSLLDSYDDVFRYDNKGNNEIIFAINFKKFESSSNWGSASYLHPAYVSPNFDPATIDAIGVMGGSPSIAISTVVRSQFSDDDQRKDATFYEIYIKDPDSGERNYYGSFSTKYKGFVENGQRQFLDDIVIYRYADVLLMKAEAKNALGQDPSEEMNEITKRAYGDSFEDYSFVNGTQSENDEAILQERLFEFTFEGKRWWDLIRFEKVYELVPSMRGKENQIPILFPIPESTLSLNSKITQNPGY